ncbi:thiosulfate sulfurtransferase activity protein [Homalodisca vitripennis]|nr:thiosulfate sulfurtransferase activity protein [Homalodisca vitripennis]
MLYRLPFLQGVMIDINAQNSFSWISTGGGLNLQTYSCRISLPPTLPIQNILSLQKHTSRNLSTNMSSVNEEFRHLDFDQLNEARKKQDTILIDVRENEELAETGTIPGAHHIPVGEVAKALATPDEEFKKMYKFSKPAQDSNVIFSCRSGKRSLAALEVALANGYSKQVFWDFVLL